jgi:hypothetical protein
LPVVLKIPRIIEDVSVHAESHPRRKEFRWRVGVGAAILMLVGTLPWLIRWHSPTDNGQEAFVPAIQFQDETNIELLPPLYAKATSNSALSTENDNGMVEILDGLVAPPPTGGPQ